MPNIKSAMKRVNVNTNKSSRNKMVKSNLKTTIKKARIAAIQEDAAAASSAYIEAQKAIDHAVSRGILHKNTAARRKSRLHASLSR